MKVACLLSGGKDSIFSYYLAKHYAWDIRCFVTIKSKNEYSYLYHTPKINLTSEIAKNLSVDLIEVETSGEKEKELDELRSALRKAKEDYGIEGIIVGAIKSEYQRIRMNEVCFELDLKFFAPMWHKEEKKLLYEMIEADFKILFAGIFAYGLNTSMLGSQIDYKRFKELESLNKKMRISVCGEGGEFESIVTYMPDFKKEIDFHYKKVVESDISGYLI